MKQNDLNDIKYKLSPQHYENIFSVYEDTEVGYFYNILKTVSFPEDIRSDVYDVYTISPMDTWPLISWNVYGTIFLWWIICSLNNIQDPTTVPEIGTTIKILKPLYIKNILNDIQRN